MQQEVITLTSIEVIDLCNILYAVYKYIMITSHDYIDDLMLEIIKLK